MDTLYLVIVGAIGWAGFAGCLWLLKSQSKVYVQINRNEKSAFYEVHPKDAKEYAGSVKIKIPVPPEMVTHTVIEPEIPEEIHRLAELADPLADQYDTVPQSGEWKRHQVYAAMLKNPKVKEIIGDDKWKAGFAIELAVAQRRMSAEEVAS